MEFGKVKASKLSFKGVDSDKTRKKKRKSAEDGGGQDGEGSGGPQEGWVNVESLEDFAGPIFIVTSDLTRCLAVAGDDDNRLVLQRVGPRGEGQQPEPEQVTEVFLAQPVAANTVALKTHKSRCLSSDKFGLVTAEGEAVGPQEEWVPVFRENGVAFQSAVYDKFLKADVDRGMLRADSDTAGFCEVFTVKCQAARKHARKRKRVEEAAKSPEQLEVEYLRNTQTWGMNRLVRPKGDEEELRRAAQSGNLYETMLDRRSKLKSDKFCK